MWPPTICILLCPLLERAVFVAERRVWWLAKQFLLKVQFRFMFSFQSNSHNVSSMHFKICRSVSLAIEVNSLDGQFKFKAVAHCLDSSERYFELKHQFSSLACSVCAKKQNCLPGLLFAGGHWHFSYVQLCTMLAQPHGARMNVFLSSASLHRFWGCTMFLFSRYWTLLKAILKWHQ